MLSFGVRATSARRLFQGVEKRAEDKQGIVRRWLGFMRKKAKERFEQLAGPKLAASTQKRYEQTRTSAITDRGEVRASYARNLARHIASKHRDKETRQLTPRGQELLSELRRLANGGSSKYSGLEQDDKTLASIRQRLEKARTTRRRVGGNKRKIERHQLLGRLRTALVGLKTELSAILRNRVPWSLPHNEGGEVGNDATLPARTTLQILIEDVQELAKIELQHLLGIRGKP